MFDLGRTKTWIVYVCAVTAAAFFCVLLLSVRNGFVGGWYKVFADGLSYEGLAQFLTIFVTSWLVILIVAIWPFARVVKFAKQHPLHHRKIFLIGGAITGLIFAMLFAAIPRPYFDEDEASWLVRFFNLSVIFIPSSQIAAWLSQSLLWPVPRLTSNDKLVLHSGANSKQFTGGR